MHRAYALLNVKAVDSDKRVITGTATTPAPDRMGDIVEPLGVTYKNPLPLLLYHDSQKPVGWVKFSKPTKDGIAFEAKLPTVDEPGTVRDRIEEAWTSIKTGLLAGVSIGFRALEYAFNKETGGMHFLKTEVLELSLVAIPAHADARIETIKSLDIGRPAASGTGRSTSPRPGASGSRTDRSMLNASEQLTQARTELQTKSARLEELESTDETNGGLEAEETTERDTLTKEVTALTAKIGRLSAIEAAQAAQATPVYGGNGNGDNHQRSAGSRQRIEVVKKELPKGALFTRVAMAVAAGKGSHSDTIAYAKRWERETPEVVAYIKAQAGTTEAGSPGWGSEFVPDSISQEFVEMFMPATIIGRLTLNPTPFLTRVIVQTGGSTVEWVGEAKKKPVGEMALRDFRMPKHKIAGIVVISDELVKYSRPNAEAQVRSDLTRQIVKFMDQQFIDISVGAGADNPASITNGVTPQAASGTDMDALQADINTALSTFDATDMGTMGLAIVTTPAIARGIAMLRDALGNTAFDGITPNGGTLFGYPVVVSNSVPAGDLIFIKQDEILLADEGRVMLDASNQATLDMGDGETVFNLWQRNCLGIRAEREITWLKRRDDAVAVISGAAYGPTSGSPA